MGRVVQKCIEKRAFLKALKIHMKTSMSETFLIKLQAVARNFIKNSPQHKCIQANFAKLLRTRFVEHLRRATSESMKSFQLDFSR